MLGVVEIEAIDIGGFVGGFVGGEVGEFVVDELHQLLEVVVIRAGDTGGNVGRGVG